MQPLSKRWILLLIVASFAVGYEYHGISNEIKRIKYSGYCPSACFNL